MLRTLLSCPYNLDSGPGGATQRRRRRLSINRRSDLTFSQNVLVLARPGPPCPGCSRHSARYGFVERLALDRDERADGRERESYPFLREKCWASSVSTR